MTLSPDFTGHLNFRPNLKRIQIKRPVSSGVRTEETQHQMAILFSRCGRQAPQLQHEHFYQTKCYQIFRKFEN